MYGQAAPASPMTITHASEAGSAMVFAVTAMAKDVRRQRSCRTATKCRAPSMHERRVRRNASAQLASASAQDASSA
jgi:hypothetical protein